MVLQDVRLQLWQELLVGEGQSSRRLPATVLQGGNRRTRKVGAQARETQAVMRTVESAALGPAGGGVAAACDAAGLVVEELCALHLLWRRRLQRKYQ